MRNSRRRRIDDELERDVAIREGARFGESPLGIAGLCLQSVSLSHTRRGVSKGGGAAYVRGCDVREDDPLDAVHRLEDHHAVAVTGEARGQEGGGGGGCGREGCGDVGEGGSERGDAVEGLHTKAVEAREWGVGDREAEGAVGAGGGDESEAGGEDGELHVGGSGKIGSEERWIGMDWMVKM